MTKNRGWECPKCGACYAPTVMKCETCVAIVVGDLPVYVWPSYVPVYQPQWPYTYPWQNPVIWSGTTTIADTATSASPPV